MRYGGEGSYYMWGDGRRALALYGLTGLVCSQWRRRRWQW